MNRHVVRLAFILLGLIAAASAFSLIQARFDDTAHERPYLVARANLSSPRDTVMTLLSNGEVAHQQVFTMGVPWVPTPSMLRMMDTADVEERPLATRRLEAAIAASHLLHILKNIPLPPLAKIPDHDAVRQQHFTRWEVPGTAVAIERVKSGPRAGQFLFSPETVALAGDIHEAIEHAAGHPDEGERSYLKWRHMPGPMIPRQLINALPASLRTEILGQALWQWIGLWILLFVSVVVSVSLIGWGVRHDATEARGFARFGQPLAALLVTGLCYATASLMQFALKVWGTPLEVMVFLLPLLGIAGGGWFAVATLRRLGEIIVSVQGFRQSSLDAQLVRVACTLLSIVIGIAFVLYAADFVGLPLGPLLAGLGIGGFAVALAVRPTLENLIGGLTLFADRPARIGEFCRVGTEMGTIEEIGVRTTKIRGLDDTLVTIPNAELAQARIQNFSRRRRFPFETEINLPIGTTGDQVRHIATEIEETLRSHEQVLEDTVRVRLTGFGEKTMKLELRAHVDVTRNSAFLAVQEELQLKIIDIIKHATEATDADKPAT